MTLSKNYYMPKGLRKGLEPVKKLAQEAGVSEDQCRKVLVNEAGHLADISSCSQK